jgi:hypothetical protein
MADLPIPRKGYKLVLVKPQRELRDDERAREWLLDAFETGAPKGAVFLDYVGPAVLCMVPEGR